MGSWEGGVKSCAEIKAAVQNAGEPHAGKSAASGMLSLKGIPLSLDSINACRYVNA